MNVNILFSTANISRNIIRSYARRVRSANPGIQKRVNILEEKENNFEDIDVEELESDFMNLGQVHKDHEKEIKYYKEKEKYWIVKQKYFKENKINFLTWGDKEQIRYLHQSNPEEWTVEKLSEGFPALPETIKKILKNKWKLNESKIRNHDEAVEQNWKLLKQGKLSDDLSPSLGNHLAKFSSRKSPINLEDRNLTDVDVSNPNLSNNAGEFSNIISSYEKIKLHDEVNKEPNKIKEYCSKTSAIEEKLKSFGNKSVTLNMIKGDSPENKSKTVTNEPEINSLENLFNKNKIPKKFTIENKISTDFVPNKNSSDLVTYPERIKIPKDKFKKGSTYKVNDCYYDDDGEFLYRVPGMY